MVDTCGSIRGVEHLKDELLRARQNLKDTNATLEKLTGRPVEFGNQRRPPGHPRATGDGDRGRGGGGSLFALAGYDNFGPPAAKRPSGTFGRLGIPVGGGQRMGQSRRNRDQEDFDDDDVAHRPALQSSVVVTPKETKTRKEAIAEQESGAGGAVGQTRNKRMFGLLLGTLAKFHEDEQTKEKQVVKQKAVEQRVEDKQKEERSRVIQERRQLFNDRLRQQAKLRSLEQKIELVEIHEAWEAETRNLEYFIRTSARPHVFFLPKSHIPASLAKLEQSKRTLQAIVAERRKQLEEEIEEIMAKGDENKIDDQEGDDVVASVDSHGMKSSGRKESTMDISKGSLSDIDDDNHDDIDYGLNEDSGNLEVSQTSVIGLKITSDSQMNVNNSGSDPLSTVVHAVNSDEKSEKQPSKLRKSEDRKQPGQERSSRKRHHSSDSDGHHRHVGGEEKSHKSGRHGDHRSSHRHDSRRDRKLDSSRDRKRDSSRDRDRRHERHHNPKSDHSKANAADDEKDGSARVATESPARHGDKNSSPKPQHCDEPADDGKKTAEVTEHEADSNKEQSIVHEETSEQSN